MLNPGVDLRMLRERLESWALEHFVCPLGTEGQFWPAGKAEAVGELLFGNVLLHGIPESPQHGAAVIPAPSCKMPCRVAGVAFAHWELNTYESGQASESFRAIQRSLAIATLSSAHREKELEKAFQLHERLLSRPLRHELVEAHGRPPMPLAHAICMHLDEGGFSLEKICRFIDLDPSRAATKRIYGRVVIRDFRSLLPYCTKYRRGNKPPGLPYECNCDVCGSLAQMRNYNHVIEMMRGPNHSEGCRFHAVAAHWPGQAE